MLQRSLIGKEFWYGKIMMKQKVTWATIFRSTKFNHFARNVDPLIFFKKNFNFRMVSNRLIIEMNYQITKICRCDFKMLGGVYGFLIWMHNNLVNIIKFVHVIQFGVHLFKKNQRYGIEM